MTRPATDDNSNAIGLFPFLAVLMSTMGALLVVLVTLAQRAGEQAAVELMQGSGKTAALSGSGDVRELVRRLDEVRQYQQELHAIRQQGESRVRDERARLSHLEEHSRRLEHELAQLTLAAQQLKATEQHQSVDHKQAEAELERLKQAITDTELQLDDLRKDGTHKRSYAVVPYQGHNGTLRKPIYIECSAKGIILQPEGLRFEATDFVDPTWPGNPLAAALRASREYLNQKAAQAGEPEPPDPYPLILVRPEGIRAYLLARLAITSWDSDFGYEFINADWKVEYPDLPDPQLARVQQHAVMIARERLLHLVQAAPSQFRGVAIGPGRGSGNGSGRGGHGKGGNGYGGDSSDQVGALAKTYGDGSGNGNGSAVGGESDMPGGNGDGTGDNSESGTGDGAGGPASGGGDFQYGAMSGAPTSGEGGTYAGGPGGNSASGEFASAKGTAGQAGAPGGTASAAGQSGGGPANTMANAGATGQTPGSGAAGGMGQPGSVNVSTGATASAAAGGAGQATASANGSARNGISTSSRPQSRTASIAESRGSDWAIEKALRSSIPVRRPIQVVVRKNQMALLPTRHATQGIEATGTVISLDQPMDRISEVFVTALKTRVDEWGLAGNGLYWKPVLELHVGPDAAETVTHLHHLLEDSGVEIRLPETAESQQGGSSNGPR